MCVVTSVVVVTRRTGLHNIASQLLRPALRPLSLGTTISTGCQHGSGEAQRIGQLECSIGRLAWKKVAVDVHRQLYGAVTHDILNNLRVHPSQRKPSPTRVTQAMEIEHLSVMVGIVQKITLLSSAEFVNVLLYLGEPR